MTVQVSELEVDVAPPKSEPRGENAPAPKAPDERKLLEALAYEQWILSRLAAD
jgi:hypothetical protein